jgi:hypothetical protein
LQKKESQQQKEKVHKSKKKIARTEKAKKTKELKIKKSDLRLFALKNKLRDEENLLKVIEREEKNTVSERIKEREEAEKQFEKKATEYPK